MIRIPYVITFMNLRNANSPIQENTPIQEPTQRQFSVATTESPHFIPTLFHPRDNQTLEPASSFHTNSEFTAKIQACFGGEDRGCHCTFILLSWEKNRQHSAHHTSIGYVVPECPQVSNPENKWPILPLWFSLRNRTSLHISLSAPSKR